MPKLRWTERDDERARKEGWKVVGDAVCALRADESYDAPRFANDSDALEHVRARADAGSTLHYKALAYCGYDTPGVVRRFPKAGKLTRPIARTVYDAHGKPIIVTLTAHGVTYRRPRHKAEYLLPHAAGETRAQVLANDGVGLPRAKRRRR
jgi:hypothetical protein